MIRERLLEFLESENITKSYFEKTIKAGNGYINNVKTIGSDKLEDILKHYPSLNIEWLITGHGDMYKKEYNAGRDNNIVEGDNKGVVGSGNSVGSINSHQINVPSEAKKIIEGDKVTIELSQSVELLQQQNMSLETRVSDLLAQLKTKDELLKAKDDMLEMYKSAIGKK